MKGSENHPRSADAALCSTAVKKGLLQQLQATIRGQALDRDDFSAMRLKSWNEAAIHQRSVDQNGAGAALALATAFFCSGQAKLMSQDVEQALHRIDLYGFRLSVDRERNFAFCANLVGFTHSRPRAAGAMLSGAEFS